MFVTTEWFQIFRQNVTLNKFNLSKHKACLK
uniref:Uncharacterized protein n=1 Tax=Anguilla anguilla TaxID=7936 RepID=A0A0E9Q265_ANGAN